MRFSLVGMGKDTIRDFRNAMAEMYQTRGPLALRAGIATGLPVFISALTGHIELGLLTFIGTFCVQYGSGTSARSRVRIQIGAISSLLLCTCLGMLAGSNPILVAVLQVLTALVAVFVVNVLRIGPPGAVFMVLAVGVGNQLVIQGTHPFLILNMNLLGALLGMFLALMDFLWDPKRAERIALQRADVAVKRFERHERIHGGTLVQANAAEALHTAWTTVCDSLPAMARPDEEELAEELREIHIRYLARSAEMAAMEHPEDFATKVNPAYTAKQADVQNRRLRDLSLGRPDRMTLLSAALKWPSEPLLISLRVFIATSLAAILSIGIGFDRVYWAIAFTVVMLNDGGTREDLSRRSFERITGTAFGIVVFWILYQLGTTPIVLAIELFALRYLSVFYIRRSYSVSVVWLTAMAMLGISGATGSLYGDSLGMLIVERLADNLIAAAVSMAVIWSTFRGHETLFIRGYGRRTVDAIMHVLDDLALSRSGTVRSMRHRRVLYTELLSNEMVSKRAAKDDPEGAGQFRGMSLELRALGYLVLGACWHPEMVAHADRFREAGVYLQRITEQPLSVQREPFELTVHIVDAHMAVIAAKEERQVIGAPAFVPLTPVEEAEEELRGDL